MSIDDLKQELRQQAIITGRRLRFAWEDQVKASEPVDTGYMKAQTRFRDEPTTTGVRVTGEVDTDYAEFVSAGTRPHVIRPRNARALRFNVGGVTVFATRVNHPGTRPNDFWTRPLRDLPRTVQTIWAQVTR